MSGDRTMAPHVLVSLWSQLRNWSNRRALKYVNKLFQFESRLGLIQPNGNNEHTFNGALTACIQSKVIDTKAENVRHAIDEVHKLNENCNWTKTVRDFFFVVFPHTQFTSFARE